MSKLMNTTGAGGWAAVGGIALVSAGAYMWAKSARRTEMTPKANAASTPESTHTPSLT